MHWPTTDPTSAGRFSRALRRIPWGSLRVRLTLLNSAVVLLTMACLLLAVRFGLLTALYHETDDTLRGEVREIALALNELHPDIDQLVAELRRKAAGHEERGWFVQLLDGAESTVWHSDNCPAAILEFPVDETKFAPAAHGEQAAAPG